MNDDPFQQLNRELDKDVRNQTLRMALADRMEEIGHSLANGYRALAVLGKNPDWWSRDKTPYVWWGGDNKYVEGVFGPVTLPRDWWILLPIGAQIGGPNWEWQHNLTRQQAEDAAAEAFLKLPVERQQEILSSAGVNS